jgi:hypothetical protein
MIDVHTSCMGLRYSDVAMLDPQPPAFYIGYSTDTGKHNASQTSEYHYLNKTLGEKNYI